MKRLLLPPAHSWRSSLYYWNLIPKPRLPLPSGSQPAGLFAAFCGSKEAEAGNGSGLGFRAGFGDKWFYRCMNFNALFFNTESLGFIRKNIAAGYSSMQITSSISERA